MATTKDFIEFVCSQIENDTWGVRYRKMFGEYMVYVNEKPLLLVCDNTVYVKELECLKTWAEKLEKGIPYSGAKEHYIVDVDDRELLNNILQELEKAIPLLAPKSQKRKSD